MLRNRENSFNKVGLDHVVLVKVATTVSNLPGLSSRFWILWRYLELSAS